MADRVDALARARRDYAGHVDDPTLTTNGKLRSDSAENRQMRAKISALEHQMKGIMGEPSIDDRNALADARAAADSLFQAALGRPVPDPIPGESPIAYRRRLATGLQKFSDSLRGANLDGVAGAALAVCEQRIYANAASAVKRNELHTRPMELREIKTDELGHSVTRYVGDPRAAWAPFGFGAGGKISINRALIQGN